MPEETKVENRGGARPGSGRKAKNKIAGEKKTEKATVNLYPSQKKYLESIYGSIQGAIDSIEIKD